MLIFISVALTVIATGMGGFIGVVLGQQKNIGSVLAFAAGIMISIVSFEVLPDAIDLTNVLFVIVFIIVGMMFVEIVERLTEHYHIGGIRSSLKKTGIILFIVIGLHNFPEGLAIGASGYENAEVGLILGMVVAIHDISEGMAIAVPLVTAGMKKRNAVIYTWASGATTILGALLGVSLGQLSNTASAIGLAVAGGAMLYVIFLEIIPEALNYEKEKKVANYVIIGIIVGLLIINLSF